MPESCSAFWVSDPTSHSMPTTAGNTPSLVENKTFIAKRKGQCEIDCNAWDKSHSNTYSMYVLLHSKKNHLHIPENKIEFAKMIKAVFYLKILNPLPHAHYS